MKVHIGDIVAVNEVFDGTVYRVVDTSDEGAVAHLVYYSWMFSDHALRFIEVEAGTLPVSALRTPTPEQLTNALKRSWTRYTAICHE